MNGVKNLLKGGIILGVAMVIVIVASRTMLAGLFTGLSTDKIADLMTFALAAFIVGGLIIIGFAAMMWRIRQSPAPRSGREEIPDANWHPVPEELAGYQAPQPLLPNPRRINVPVYRFNAQAAPIGAQPETVLTSSIPDATTQAQITLEVPLRYLYRFAKCPTPAREEWTGKPTVFYDCQRFFDAHGFLAVKGKAKVWRDSYPIKSRLDWLAQFEPGAPAGETSPTPLLSQKQDQDFGYPVTGNRSQEQETGTKPQPKQ